MKKFLAILLSALLVVSALAVTVIADTVNWEDGHTVDDIGDYTFDNAYGFVFNINYVDGTIAGEDNTLIVTPSAYVSSNPNWAISVFLAATDDANVYEVISVVSCPANVEGWDINTLWPMSANACLIAHSAYSNANGTNWQAKVAAMALKEGDKITISEDNTTATVQDAPEGYVVTNGVVDEPTTVPEVITVDGDLSDNGWAAEGWTEVTPENGYWQTVPTTTDTLSYKYQFRTDDTKLYAAFEIDCAAVEGGNGNGTTIRLWLNTDAEYQLYTHFYEVIVGGCSGKYNTAKDANSGSAIENSSIEAVLTSDGEKTYAEFSVDLNEFGGEDGFNYFISVSNKINENVCLYYPANDEPAEGESRTAKLPYAAWNTEKAAAADVEELALGEITVEDPEVSDPEESDPEVSEPAEDLEAELKDFVGEAVDGKFDLVIDAPETYKAGDEITVTVTVANITAENGLHVVKFNFYYDSEKLVLTNDLDEEEDNRLVCIDEENLPSKWENFTKVNNDFDAENAEGTEVKALNDGIIYASALTDKDSSSTAIKEDGKVVFTFTFTANADAEGDIGLAIPHAEVEGALNNAAGAELYAGNGGYAIIAADAGDVSEPDVSEPEVSEPEESKPEEPVVPGDASNMLVFAIIALVAIAGSAVVIKTRK